MFFWENGFNLKERLVPPGLSNAASAAVEALKINSITEKVRRGRRVVVKRRNAHGEQMAELANFYFRTWNIPIRFLSKVKAWRLWEIKSFNVLNGDRFRAVASGEWDGSRGQAAKRKPLGPHEARHADGANAKSGGQGISSRPSILER